MMGRKKNKPQKRTRTKETVGQKVFIDVVYLDYKKNELGEKVMLGRCSCDKWTSSDDAKTLGAIGREAKEHVNASNGKCRLRPHDPEEQSIIEKKLDEHDQELMKQRDEQLMEEIRGENEE